MKTPAVVALAPDAAAAYLLRDPGGNVELAVSLLHDEDVSCCGVIADNQIAGVLVAGRQWPGAPLIAMIETADRAVLAALTEALPRSVTEVAVHRPWMQPVYARFLHLTPLPHADLLVLTTTVPPPVVPEVRLLTEADAAIVAASATPWGNDGFIDALERGYRPFGIVRDDRVIARAMAAYTTGMTEEVAAVWTAPAWRGNGFATAVTVTIAADILTRVPLATYMVPPGNHASQQVAAKAGFVLDHRTTIYRAFRRR